jgi:hypothetical protein
MLPAIKIGITLITALAPLYISTKEKKNKHKQFIEGQLYCGFNSGDFTEKQVRVLCREHSIKYPPKPVHKLIPND